MPLPFWTKNCLAVIVVVVFFPQKRQAAILVSLKAELAAILRQYGNFDKKPKEPKKYAEEIVKNWFLGHFDIVKVTIIIKKAINGFASHLANKVASLRKHVHPLPLEMYFDYNTASWLRIAGEEGNKSGRRKETYALGCFYFLMCFSICGIFLFFCGFLFICGQSPCVQKKTKDPFPVFCASYKLEFFPKPWI